MFNIQQLLQYSSELTLLYVEDDKAIQELNSEIFLDFFHLVTLASNGEEGIAAYCDYYEKRNLFYDIVITDIRMPKVNGIALSRFIKEKNPEQVIIVLSAYKDSDYLFELINMGITYFLSKPISFEALCEMLLHTSKIVYDRMVAQKYSKKLTELNLQLEQKVVELKDAVEKAEEATRFKERFLANISHDIRTPLNAITSLSHLLMHSTLQDKERNSVERIQSAATMLLDLINNVLDISKIEAGKLYLENITFDFYEIIERVVSIIQIKAQAKDVMLSYDINEAVPRYLIGDSVRISQIFLNLIDNAVKFTYQGTVFLHVKNISNEGNICLLSCDIIDSGVGIAEDKFETLFDSFVQADNSTTRKYGGSGLGLSIVKQLVTMMGGHIKVSNNQAGGATFSFSLKLPCAEEDLHVNTLMPLHESVIKSIELQQATVLLVEDNELNLYVLLNLLENTQAHILVAKNGIEALDIIKNETKIDLILMDINMPLMDGYELTRRIREGLHMSTVPIVAISANTMQKDIEKALNAGMSDYLIKPINIKRFYEILILHIKESSLKYKPLESVSDLKEHPFRKIAGLDVDGALESMEFNSALYEKIIDSFFSIFENASEHLRRSLQEGDYEHAYRLCHDIKSSSGNIGATKLYSIASHMEDAIIRRDFEGALLDLKRYEKTFMQLYQLVTEQKNFIDSKGN